MATQTAHDDLIFEKPEKRERFSEPAKFVPVIFLSCTMLTLYSIFTFLHCVPLLQLDVAPTTRDPSLRAKGMFQLIVYQILVFMLVVCYVTSILVNPGEVPEDDPQWQYPTRDQRRENTQTVTLSLQETKRSGDRRHCKWCGKYKPDRTHHCRVCRCCILKMDHHCPWLYNCVGFNNYKPFFLWLFYSVLTLHFMVWCMSENVKSLTIAEAPFYRMFLILFGETLAFSLGCLVSTFWGFHIWLMMKSMTTIEFCEKSTPKVEHEEGEDKRLCAGLNKYNSSVYDLGHGGNIRTVLGKNPLLWLLPFSPPPGDGMSFVNDDTRLTNTLDAARGLRKKTHRRTQRTSPRLPRSYAGAGNSTYYDYSSTDFQN